MDKVVSSPTEAVADISDCATLAVGGFGLCGIPSVLIAELQSTGVRDLECISNNCGVDDWGLGVLLRDKRLRLVTASYVGENKEFGRQFLAGEVTVNNQVVTSRGHSLIDGDTVGLDADSATVIAGGDNDDDYFDERTADDDVDPEKWRNM